MKRLFVVLLFAVVLVGCGISTTTEASNQARFSHLNKRLTITTDSETGCKYIIYREVSGYAGMGGITPLMKPDGTQDCD